MSAKHEAERLLNVMLPFGKQMLSRHGEFFPYGSIIMSDGRIVDVGAKVPGNDRPPSAALKQILEDDLRQRAQRSEIRASAIAFMVNVSPPNSDARSDAIQVNVDHRDGYSAEVFLPFEVANDGSVTYGSMFAQQGDHAIFRERESCE